eukprot:gnl/MRDRNA2_/MRDRNA2_224641_c0_seq1.p1 gnl/MRDRNA2_/MRDRNA2_224641_c0~~gnl/MRDRNA2_/MRDRNA2_224641_c0_seq1.p1  ORF type:complete len:197 (+),score=36.13 gnl/MRDRNA2_/MRDRNA2_224641_c0_seq1:64-591(+)
MSRTTYEDDYEEENESLSPALSYQRAQWATSGDCDQMQQRLVQVSLENMRLHGQVEEQRVQLQDKHAQIVHLYAEQRRTILALMTQLDSAVDRAGNPDVPLNPGNESMSLGYVMNSNPIYNLPYDDHPPKSASRRPDSKGGPRRPPPSTQHAPGQTLQESGLVQLGPGSRVIPAS